MVRFVVGWDPVDRLLQDEEVRGVGCNFLGFLDGALGVGVALGVVGEGSCWLGTS